MARMDAAPAPVVVGAGVLIGSPLAALAIGLSHLLA